MTKTKKMKKNAFFRIFSRQKLAKLLDILFEIHNNIVTQQQKKKKQQKLSGINFYSVSQNIHNMLLCQTKYLIREREYLNQIACQRKVE